MNDYANEDVNIKSDAMYALVKDLLAKGIPLHGVGFQFHLDLDNPLDYNSVFANMKRFADLGLEIHFTEMDVRIKGEITEDKLFKQATVYKKRMEILLNFPTANSYILWGFTDAHSWIPGFFTDYSSGLIFDEYYQPKPAFYILQETLGKGPVPLPYTADLGGDMANRFPIPAFQAMPATKAPTLDGVVSPGEWDEGVLYKFAYNQLNPADQRPPKDQSDLDGTWKILYQKNMIYGLVTRDDDTTVTKHKDPWENDNLEIFVNHNGQFAQLRSIVGLDWADKFFLDQAKIVWSPDGKVAEFMAQLPEADLTGLIIGWNIALSDNDKGVDGARKYQMYPMYGLNVSWQGKDLCELKFVGDTPRPTDKRFLPLPFNAAKAAKAPTIDGVIEPGEWDGGTVQTFAYNQLNLTDERPPQDQNDLSGDWKILYDKNIIYGLVTRTDDATVTKHKDAWENDNLEIFINLQGQFAQLRSIVGSDWAEKFFLDEAKAMWSPDGSAVEFMAKLPIDTLTGKIIGWNIALSDNDKGPDGARKYQMYPIYGFNDGWQGKNLAEIKFQE